MIHNAHKISMYHSGLFSMNTVSPNFLLQEKKHTRVSLPLPMKKIEFQTKSILCGSDECFGLLFVWLQTLFHFWCAFLARLSWSLLFLGVWFFRIHKEIYLQMFILLPKSSHNFHSKSKNLLFVFEWFWQWNTQLPLSFFLQVFDSFSNHFLPETFLQYFFVLFSTPDIFLN